METNNFVPTCCVCRHLSQHGKEQCSGVDYLVVSYYFVPFTFHGDFSNDVEYFEGSENNMFIPPETFIKNGINGYNMNTKDTNVFPNIIHVVGAYDG